MSPERTSLALCVDVLGPLVLRVEGRTVDVPGVRRRALLALLALEGGRGVERRPAGGLPVARRTAANAVQALYNHVSRLRGHLGPLAEPARAARGRLPPPARAATSSTPMPPGGWSERSPPTPPHPPWPRSWPAPRSSCGAGRRWRSSGPCPPWRSSRSAWTSYASSWSTTWSRPGWRPGDRSVDRRRRRGGRCVAVARAHGAAARPGAGDRRPDRGGDGGRPGVPTPAGRRDRPRPRTRAGRARAAWWPRAPSPHRCRDRRRPPGGAGPTARWSAGEHDREEVIRLLGDNAIVTLTGPGGVGKTRLALDVAAEPGVATGQDVVVVDLAAVDRPERVCAGGRLHARAAHHRRGAPPPTSRPRSPGRELLAGARQLRAPARRLPRPGGHRCGDARPEVRVLATSRATLHVPGEYVVRLQPLPVPRDRVRPRRAAPAARASARSSSTPGAGAPTTSWPPTTQPTWSRCCAGWTGCRSGSSSPPARSRSCRCVRCATGSTGRSTSPPAGTAPSTTGSARSGRPSTRRTGCWTRTSSGCCARSHRSPAASTSGRWRCWPPTSAPRATRSTCCTGWWTPRWSCADAAGGAVPRCCSPCGPSCIDEVRARGEAGRGASTLPRPLPRGRRRARTSMFGPDEPATGPAAARRARQPARRPRPRAGRGRARRPGRDHRRPRRAVAVARPARALGLGAGARGRPGPGEPPAARGDPRLRRRGRAPARRSRPRERARPRGARPGRARPGPDAGLPGLAGARVRRALPRGLRGRRENWLRSDRGRAGDVRRLHRLGRAGHGVRRRPRRRSRAAGSCARRDRAVGVRVPHRVRGVRRGRAPCASPTSRRRCRSTSRRSRAPAAPGRASSRVSRAVALASARTRIGDVAGAAGGFAYLHRLLARGPARPPSCGPPPATPPACCPPGPAADGRAAADLRRRRAGCRRGRARRSPGSADARSRRSPRSWARPRWPRSGRKPGGWGRRRCWTEPWPSSASSPTPRSAEPLTSGASHRGWWWHHPARVCGCPIPVVGSAQSWRRLRMPSVGSTSKDRGTRTTRRTS